MMHRNRILSAGCLAALLFSTSACQSIGPNGEVTRTYEVHDLVLPQAPATKPFLPMYTLLVNVVQATGLKDLPKGTYIVRPEEKGVLMVRATPAIQGQVDQVLSDLRNLRSKTPTRQNG